MSLLGPTYNFQKMRARRVEVIEVESNVSWVQIEYAT
jgi:hypothetical protein